MYCIFILGQIDQWSLRDAKMYRCTARVRSERINTPQCTDKSFTWISEALLLFISACVRWPEGVGSVIETQRVWIVRTQSQQDFILTDYLNVCIQFNLQFCLYSLPDIVDPWQSHSEFWELWKMTKAGQFPIISLIYIVVWNQRESVGLAAYINSPQ